MPEGNPPSKKSELEQKYEDALQTIAGGNSWETIVAKSVLGKQRGTFRRFVAYLKDNLAAIVSLVVAISGISFGILQYKTGQWQKQRELTIAKVEALEKLLPSLTSENPNTRRYALSALFTLYSDDSSSTDSKEILALLTQIGEVGDAETVHDIATRLGNAKLRKRAAELYAIEAEKNRYHAEAAEKPVLDTKQQAYEKARQYLSASWNDTQKALDLDPENTRALYQLGRLLMEEPHIDLYGATHRFSQVIKLIDEQSDTRDKEIYVKSHLNRTRCWYELDKKITPRVCQAYKETKTKYQESGLGELNVEDEHLQELENGCRSSE